MTPLSHNSSESEDNKMISILKNDLSYAIELLDSSDQTNTKNKNAFNSPDEMN